MNNKGFTLVEMVVSVLMYSLIMVLFTTAVLAFSRMYELASKLDDVANDAEVIYKTIDKAYKEATDVEVSNHRMTIDGVTYYFDRTSKDFYINDRSRLNNKDIITMYIYDYTKLNNTYEVRIVYYNGGVLFELLFHLANFKER